MDIKETVQQFVHKQKTSGVDHRLTTTQVFDVWDCLFHGDDNSENDSRLGLCSDLTVWEILTRVGEMPECPRVITIENTMTGEWRRTTWEKLVTAALNQRFCKE